MIFLIIKHNQIKYGNNALSLLTWDDLKKTFLLKIHGILVSYLIPLSEKRKRQGLLSWNCRQVLVIAISVRPSEIAGLLFVFIIFAFLQNEL